MPAILKVAASPKTRKGRTRANGVQPSTDYRNTTKDAYNLPRFRAQHLAELLGVAEHRAGLIAALVYGGGGL